MGMYRNCPVCEKTVQAGNHEPWAVIFRAHLLEEHEMSTAEIEKLGDLNDGWKRGGGQ